MLSLGVCRCCPVRPNDVVDVVECADDIDLSRTVADVVIKLHRRSHSARL